MVCEALRAGKAVFVEKPLAVDPDQLEAIVATVGESGNDRLMVGFNRRFAPLLTDLKRAFGARSGPVQVRYDVNAGRLEAGSWYAQPEEGSRLVGEGCHFVDTISWWLDQDPVAVFAAATGDPDDTASTLRYPDGSVATIAYQTSGDPHAPKELFQATGDGRWPGCTTSSAPSCGVAADARSTAPAPASTRARSRSWTPSCGPWSRRGPCRSRSSRW